MSNEASDIENDRSTPISRGATAAKGRNMKAAQRKKMFRWTATNDCLLVSEVVLMKPFLETGERATEAWSKIVKSVNETFPDACVDVIAVKRHFTRLLANFKTEDFKTRYKSGTEEEVTTIMDQLSEVVSLIDDSKIIAEEELAEKTKKTDTEKAVAEEIRGAALSTVKSKLSNEESPPIKKRLTEKSLSDLWAEKQESDRLQQEKKMEHEERKRQEELIQRDKDREMRLKEMELREKALDLERIKHDHQFQLQEEELRLQKQRFEVEKEERSSAVQTQKAMLELLLKHLK
ncbi:unnamed protein product [Orchesella dallaii]|uniref:Uncharacterized protein n=1 Tax=Orchesella dallaii TaxID=48710 RepID=A0ABP1QP61_9HEXA